MEPAQKLHFSTAGLPPSLRAERWRAALDGFVVRGDLSIADTATFRADIYARRTRDGSLIAGVTSAPCQIVHRREHVAAIEDGLMIICVLRGGGIISQAGADLPFRSGDIVVRQAGLPSQVRFAKTSRSVVFKIPRARAQAYVPAPHTIRPFRIDGAEGLAAATVSLLGGVARHLPRLGYDSITAVENAALELLARPIRASRGSGLTSGAARQWRRIEQIVEDELTNPDLSIAHIAKAMGVSSRSIYAAFAARRRRFRQYLIEKRLERCRAALADPRQSDVTLTRICFQAGFNDFSHFSRAFKARYGRSPRAYRDAIGQPVSDS